MTIVNTDPNKVLTLDIRVTASTEPEFELGRTIIKQLDIQTERVPVEITVRDCPGMWIVQPPNGWVRNDESRIVLGLLSYTDGDRFVEHKFELTAEAVPTNSKPKPLPIRIKPVVVGPDPLPKT